MIRTISLRYSSTVLILFYVLDVSVGFLQNAALAQNPKTWNENAGIYWDLDNRLNRVRRSPLQPINVGNNGKTKLIEAAECRGDIKRLCSTLNSNSEDLDVLECIQSFKVSELSGISESCQHTIWSHMMDLIDDANLRDAAQVQCSHDFANLDCKVTERSGMLLACMIDHREKILSTSCRAFIQRMEWVAFSDFRIVTRFTDDCMEDITRHSCGRLQVKEVNYMLYLGLEGKRF